MLKLRYYYNYIHLMAFFPRQPE